MIYQVLKGKRWETVSPDDLSQYSDRVFGSFRKHAAYYEDLRREFAGGTLFYDLMRNAGYGRSFMTSEKYQRLSFYQYYEGNRYARGFLIRNFGFNELEGSGSSRILRCFGKSFPYMMDCYYLREDDEISFAVIFSFAESRVCFIDPREAVTIIPRFIQDDRSGADFFSDLSHAQTPENINLLKKIDDATRALLLTEKHAIGKLPDFGLAMDKGTGLYRVYASWAVDRYRKAVAGAQRVSFCQKHSRCLIYTGGAALIIFLKLLIFFQR